MKAYSPSQTSEWLRCPMKRALRREGWLPKATGRADWAGAMGSAFAAGVAVYNNTRREFEQGGTSMPPRHLSIKTAQGADPERVKMAEASYKIATSILAQRLAQWEELGLIVDSGDDYIEKLGKRVQKAVVSYVMTDPIPDSWRIIEVETDLGERAGHARPDLVARDDLGLVVVDYKSKLKLMAEWRNKTVMEFAHSHQQFHYAHFVGEKFNEPILRYYIALAVFEPSFACDLLPYAVNQEMLSMWHQSASVVWERMAHEDSGAVPPTLAAQHSDQYGQCPYYKACFVHNLDPALMAHDFKHVERVKEEESNA